MARVKVSSKHQIAMPSAVRRKLNIRPGDHLLVDVREGYVVLMPEPSDYAKHLQGLHSDIWKGIEPEEYVRREREAWKD